jgi:hypothetical protein
MILHRISLSRSYMQSPVIRRRTLFIRNPTGKQEKFDVVVAVSRHRAEADNSRAAVERATEEATREFSAIFEQLVVSGKIPVRIQRQEPAKSGGQYRSSKSSPISILGKLPLKGKGNDL